MVNGDIWVDSDATDYPAIYKWSSSPSAWVKVDNTDQVTGDGIIFVEMRDNPSSSLSADAPQQAVEQLEYWLGTLDIVVKTSTVQG